MAAQRRRNDEHDRGMAIAWTAAFVHFKTKANKGRMPELKTLLAKRPTKPQTIREQKTMLHAIADLYGLTVRKATRPKARHG